MTELACTNKTSTDEGQCTATMYGDKMCNLRTVEVVCPTRRIQQNQWTSEHQLSYAVFLMCLQLVSAAGAVGSSDPKRTSVTRI